ncbi:hypothetical protein BCV69DRAFT_284106 [Microstroma glucosiphilum]|uniref:Uncharacterized protein n=1 Tax=Pseudomicrostroma glucosiphilum TaxID=1684307 RepID=A0A316U913_9BASI|nr:hypothetical protein BCV69DRAFT_284106 [Pseudomicrostroma glucosiphilum]PWN19475.1 hypothetical protein BCV69DRAFT_284106 [Pseudomicrostroma glucosiphilum]
MPPQDGPPPPSPYPREGAAPSPSAKGKGKASDPPAASASDQGSAPAKQSSLLRSALGHSADLSSSLSNILTSNGKGVAAQPQSGGSAGDPSLLAEASTSTPSSAASRSGTGPRQGFRTTASTASTPHFALPASSSSYPSVANFNATSPSAAEYGSFEALNRGLHDVVRRQSLGASSRLSRTGQHAERGERQSSHDRDTQGLGSGLDRQEDPSTEDLLDPAYHEAWASSIPMPSVVSSDPRTAEYAEQEADLVHAWEKALRPAPDLVPDFSTSANATSAWPPSDGRPAPGAPRTAEQGGFMDLLAAEEAGTAEEDRRQATGSDVRNESQLQDGFEGQTRSKAVEEAAAYQPAPEPLHAIQSTDPREALSFLLGPSTSSSSHSRSTASRVDDGQDSKAKMRDELADLKRRLEEAEGADTVRGASGTGGAAAPMPTSGLDRTARRIQRRVQLARIEYDISILEGRMGHGYGYHEEINAPYAAAAYASPPDLTQVVDEGGEGEEEMDTESEMDQRRRRAIERLESLRRHLDAKL